ncbi:hypothetical protein P879_01984 [Paragonimus westermani]|uniref:F5/8 type C domain-containing protein n=1 Tax=Paragonimus westermani TaxID=34504 RepID=A0A8T0DSH3_9TREM|nr:hypothetical protein P879_01984 [Paragonimus westermani]
MTNLFRSSVSEHVACSVLCIFVQLITQLLTTTVSAACNSRLLSDRTQVPDSAFEHSSAVNFEHGASAARDDPSDMSLQERAWCPDTFIHTELREFMQIDLGRQSVIKLIITKGRVAKSKGRQSTPYFYVKYRREKTGLWFEYSKENGTQRLSGNQDAMTENYNTMEPPFVARFIRIYPFSLESTKTCLKLELLGCSANGVVEYLLPQGTFLSETVLPSYTYESRSAQTRFQDYSYDASLVSSGFSDSLSDKHERTQHFLTKLITPPLVLRGGLGKLTDNDTEAHSGTSPFSSYKFVAWKRQSYFHKLRRRSGYQSLDGAYYPGGISSSLWDRSVTELEHIRLVFRFDDTYNFSRILLHVSNDFHNNVAIPKNITAHFSMTHPESGSKLNKEQTTSVFFILEPDRSSATSRWVPLETKLATVHPSASSARNISGYSTRAEPGLGVGQYVELKLYFASDWIAVGEVAFENHKVDPAFFNEQLESNPLIPSSSELPLGSTVTTPSSTIVSLMDAGSVNGQPATFTLAAICGVLAVLICVGLLCMLFLWRHTSFRSQFHRGKKRVNGSTNFECLNEPSNLNSNHVKYDNSCLESCKNIPNDAQTQFQHPQHFHEMITTTGPPSFVPGLQLYTSHLGASFNIPNTALPHSLQPVLANLEQVRARPLQPNGSQFIPVSSEPGNAPLTNKLNQPGELVHFLPLTNSQIPQVGCLSSLIAGSIGQKMIPDSAIYTSLPGSDCESQPYARIGNSGTIPGQSKLTEMMERRVPCANFMDPGTDLGVNYLTVNGSPQLPPNSLIHPSLLPPPPCLPLPPIPTQHFSPSSSRESACQLQDEQADSGTPLLGVEAKDRIQTAATTSMGWGPQPPNGNNLIWLTRGLNHGEQLLTSPLSNFQTFPGSDYSNATISSSTNAYGAYYGAPTMFPQSDGPVPTVYPLQIRR